MGYYLLDNRNPNGDHYYPYRNSTLRVIVLHITAGLEDLDGVNDSSAERTAHYAATTSRVVSWHAGADSDSHLYLLPASYTAFHVRGYNSLTWGLEMSKRDTTWSDEPKAWVEDTLRNAAAACRPVVESYGIPLRRLTKSQVHAGMKGFVYHSDLDPDRRTDPGRDFPIDRLFELIGDDDMPSPKDWDAADRAAVRKAIHGENHFTKYVDMSDGKNIDHHLRHTGDTVWSHLMPDETAEDPDTAPQLHASTTLRFLRRDVREIYNSLSQLHKAVTLLEQIIERMDSDADSTDA